MRIKIIYYYKVFNIFNGKYLEIKTEEKLKKGQIYKKYQVIELLKREEVLENEM